MAKHSPVVVSAPSKIILHGEHAVVYGKTAVAASIGLRTRMTLTPLPPDRATLVKVHFPDMDIEEEWTKDQVARLLKKRPDVCLPGPSKKRNLSDATEYSLSDVCRFSPEGADSAFLLEIFSFLGVDQADLKMSSLVCFFYLYALLCREEEGLRFPPIHISVESDIPIGVGLGSSAALSVCLAAGLLSIRDQIFDGGAGSIGDRRLWEICQLARISEEILHGNCSGIDNSVSTYGGLVKFAHFSKVDDDGLKRSFNLRILLVGTHVKRNTKHLVERVRQSVKEFPDVVKPVIDAIDAVSKDCIATLEKMTDHDDAAAFRRLEKLVSYNQKLLTVLDVSHPTLAKVCQIASSYGLQAKLTGAGGGGYAFVLIPPYANEDTVDKAKEELRRNGFTCQETELGVEGVRCEGQCSCSQR